MEWLKDKKNLPIVIGLVAVVLLAAIGLIAFELGAFSGSSTAVTRPVASGAGVYPGGAPGSYPGAVYPGGAPGAVYPGGAPGGYPGGFGGARTAGRPVASAAAPAGKAPPVDPRVGGDPFAIPGSQKKLASQKALLVPKIHLSDALPSLNLYQLHPPATATVPPPDINPAGGLQMADTRVSGIVNSSDGIFAVVDVNGTSQTVTPGQALVNGNKVVSIQSSAVTLRTPTGETVTIPLSNGAPISNQGNPYAYGGGFGYPGGGYPGSFGGGYPGGGYPGGFGGGYPGGGYPGAFGGGYPGGGFDAGGGYPGG